MKEFLEFEIFDNRVQIYLLALFISIAAITALWLLQRWGLVRLSAVLSRLGFNRIDALVRNFKTITMPLLYFGAIYAGIIQLSLPGEVEKILGVLWVALLTFQAARLILLIIFYFLAAANFAKSLTGTSRSLPGLVRLIVWGGAVIFLLDNFGFNVTAIVAGLGIGGIAVALAAQTILGDLFNYFVIFFDRPFETGDFVITGDILGVIENIGIKSTRIRSLSGEQVVMSNSDLTSSRIRNYKRMNERRVLFKFGVVYGTSLDAVKKIPGLVRRCIESIPQTRFDRAHFQSFGDFSLNFEVVYYVLSPDYNRYMDIQQEINFGVKESLEREGIEFAFPTQTLYHVRKSL